MKKIFLIVLLAMLSCTVLYSQQDKPIITVLDMETNGISESEMRTIISILSSALFKTGYFTVIDVGERETVLQELEFSMSGCSDDSCMLEVGKMLSAEAIVVGKIGKIGKKYVISSKMLETETARTISSADGMYPDIDTLLENIYQIADELSIPQAPVAEPLAEPVTEPVTEIATEDAETIEPAGLNIPAVATLAGGIISAGAGAYFLAVSIPLIIDYFNAKESYVSAAEDPDEVAVLWSEYENARLAATDENTNTKVILGSSLAAAGIAASVVSIFLFKDQGDTAAELSFIPAPGASVLSCRVSY